MAIYRKPKSNPNNNEAISLSKDEEALRFIGMAPNQPVTVPTPTPSKKKRARKEPVLIRIDPAILERVDQAAEKRGISRSAWISAACTRTLELEND